MPYLESISPSRSTMLEDSTRLACEMPLTESGKARLVRYSSLLAMASKRVGCSPFLPTTESIVTLREIVRMRQTKRAREHSSER